VFKGLANRGKTSVDWFFGSKLHLVVNEFGQLLNVILTPGNIDDRQPVQDLLSSLSGQIFADRGLVTAMPTAASYAKLVRNPGVVTYNEK
jgi:transposase